MKIWNQGSKCNSLCNICDIRVNILISMPAVWGCSICPPFLRFLSANFRKTDIIPQMCIPIVDFVVVLHTKPINVYFWGLPVESGSVIPPDFWVVLSPTPWDAKAQSAYASSCRCPLNSCLTCLLLLSLSLSILTTPLFRQPCSPLFRMPHPLDSLVFDCVCSVDPWHLCNFL